MRKALVGTVAVAALVVGSAWPAGAGTAPADLSGEEVCDLVADSAVGAALGVTVSAATPSTSGTPQCSYAFRSAGGVSTNVIVAVSRVDDDLGGRTGAKAHKYAVKANKTYAAKGSKFIKVKGVGTRATFADGKATKNFIVAASDGRVLTVVGSELDLTSAKAIANAAVGNLG